MPRYFPSSTSTARGACGNESRSDDPDSSRVKVAPKIAATMEVRRLAGESKQVIRIQPQPESRELDRRTSELNKTDRKPVSSLHRTSRSRRSQFLPIRSLT